MAMMMTKCDVCGAFYNAEKDVQCPFCKESAAAKQDEAANERTVLIWDKPVAEKEEPKKTETPKVEPVQATPVTPEPVKTVNEPVKKTENKEFDNIYPVVGWAVITKGEQIGRDYRIHSENNFIGSSDRMDIQIVGDSMISENHALIVYDPVEVAFYISLTEGKGIVRVNDKVLLQPTKLNSHDRITIGSTEITFVAFCGEHFNWDK